MKTKINCLCKVQIILECKLVKVKFTVRFTDNSSISSRKSVGGSLLLRLTFNSDKTSVSSTVYIKKKGQKYKDKLYILKDRHLFVFLIVKFAS